MASPMVVSFLYILSGSLYYWAPGWGNHVNSTGTNLNLHEFKHPFFLACLKFFGQTCCVILYFIIFGRTDTHEQLDRRHRPHNRPVRGPHQRPFPPEEPDPKIYNKMIFIPCTLCDMARTGLLFVGLNLTYHSSYIMLCGTVTFFTALLSVAFLATPLQKRMWFGICVSVVAMGVVGLRDYIFFQSAKYDKYGIAAGDLLIVMAMIMTSIQVILEQRFVKKHDISPLLAVGIEGVYGFILSLILVVIFYFINVGGFNKVYPHRLEDFIDAFIQMKNSWRASISVILSIVSTCFYYYFGINIAKNHDHGAVSRMVLDNIPSLIVFTVFLLCRWQNFCWGLTNWLAPCQLIMLSGYVLLVIGIMFYYDIVFYGIYLRIRRMLNCPEPTLPGAEDTHSLLPHNHHDYGSPEVVKDPNRVEYDVRQRIKVS